MPRQVPLLAKKRPQAKHFPAADKPATSNDCTLKARMPRLEGGALRLGLPSMGPISRHTQQVCALPVFLCCINASGQDNIPAAEARDPSGRPYLADVQEVLARVASPTPSRLALQPRLCPCQRQAAEPGGGGLKPRVQELPRPSGSILHRSCGTSSQAALWLPANRREITWARLRSPPSASSCRLCVRAREAAISALIWPS